MSGPIIFVSHLRVRQGRLAEVKSMTARVTEQIHAAKPQTTGFLAYLSHDESMVTIVHVFADAQAMDLHFEGADDRSQAAYELVEQVGWEIYGEPSGEAMATMRAGAAATGAGLIVEPFSLGGFLRPQAPAAR
jgi:hypothetical protein